MPKSLIRFGVTDRAAAGVVGGIAFCLALGACGPRPTPKILPSPVDPVPSPIVEPEVTNTDSRGTSGISARIRETWRPDAKYKAAQSRYDEWLAECKKRLGRPGGKEWCDKNEPVNPGRPYEGMLGVERVTLAQALEWWPYRPLLKAGYLPRQGGDEIWFVTGQSGRKADPKRERSGVKVFYVYPPTAPDRSSSGEMLAAGAFSVDAYFLPPGEKSPFAGPFPNEKPVVVRGHPARLWVGNFDAPRTVAISWLEPLANGGILSWTVLGARDVYTEEQVIEFVNKLLEVR